MRLLTLVTALCTYLNPLFREVAHPSSGWNEPRRRFVIALVLAIVSAGTTVLSDVVRAMPGGTAIRYRYKAVDRMLARADLVGLAAAQTARLADGVGAGWVVPIDMTDIRKLYAKKMEYLAGIHDGSTGQIGRGYSVVTACAFHLAGRSKAQPLPLLFEVFSSAEEDFKSQNTFWLDAIDRIHAVAPRATVAIDREGDNGKLLRRLLDHHQPFVTRRNTHEHSRHLLFGATSRARVMDVWKEATLHGELTATRLADDGGRKPYRCDYSSMRVRLPERNDALWLCVFDSIDHEQPMVILTNQPADSAEQTTNILAMYFARWAIEDMHRWAKQELGLEDVRLLTWHRVKNMVAATWLAMGFAAHVGRGPEARPVLEALETKGQQLRKPHTDGQFWGYAIVRGLRAVLADGRRVLHLFEAMRPPKPDRQLGLPGFGA